MVPNDRMDRMLDNCGMSVENYDSTLVGWSQLDAGETQIPVGMALDADWSAILPGVRSQEYAY